MTTEAQERQKRQVFRVVLGFLALFLLIAYLVSPLVAAIQAAMLVFTYGFLFLVDIGFGKDKADPPQESAARKEDQGDNVTATERAA